MSAVKTRRQAAADPAAASAPSTPIPKNLQIDMNDQIIMNGNGSAHNNLSDSAAGENIFLFIPNVIGESAKVV